MAARSQVYKILVEAGRGHHVRRTFLNRGHECHEDGKGARTDRI
jgi:hypothetical protein